MNQWQKQMSGGKKIVRSCGGLEVYNPRESIGLEGKVWYAYEDVCVFQLAMPVVKVLKARDCNMHMLTPPARG